MYMYMYMYAVYTEICVSLEKIFEFLLACTMCLSIHSLLLWRIPHAVGEIFLSQYNLKFESLVKLLVSEKNFLCIQMLL